MTAATASDNEAPGAKLKETVTDLKPSCIIDLSIIYSNYLKPENIFQVTSSVIHNDFKNYTYINNNEQFEEIPHVCIEGGDNKYCSIAAASILAKVERDSYIEELCNKHPELIDFDNMEEYARLRRDVWA